MGYQNWSTPPEFMDWVNSYILASHGRPRIALDACATIDNAKAPQFIGPPECAGQPGYSLIDGLRSSWATHGTVWCNPGFSHCPVWLAKAHKECEAGVRALVLTHACHGSGWFREFLPGVRTVYLINPRINFLPPKGVKPSSNPKDNLLWYFDPGNRPNYPEFVYPPAWR